MNHLATTAQQTKATPDAIFKLWADINNWPAYDQGIEWTRFSQVFAAGSTYTLKPKGGPKVSATILEVLPNKKFIDVSHLFGASLRFEHTIEDRGDQRVVTVDMSLSGPMSWLWARILGKNQQAALEQSTAKLIEQAEKTS